MKETHEGHLRWYRLQAKLPAYRDSHITQFSLYMHEVRKHKSLLIHNVKIVKKNIQ